MQRTLFFWSLLCSSLLLFSCTKQESTSDDGGKKPSSSGDGGSPVALTKLEVAPKLTMADNADCFLPVTLEPEKATWSDVRITMEPDDLVEWSEEEGGLLLKPLRRGTGRLTLGPKTGSLDKVTCEINVSTSVSSIKFKSSSPWYDDLQLSLSVGHPLDLHELVEATYSDGKQYSNYRGPIYAKLEDLSWSVSGIEDYISYDPETGILTAKKCGAANVVGLLSIGVTDGDFTVSKQVHVYDAPKSITVSENSFTLELLGGPATKNFVVNVTPSTARPACHLQWLNENGAPQDNSTYTETPTTNGVTFAPKKAHIKTGTVVIFPVGFPDIKKTVSVNVLQYAPTYCKKGDYLYYNAAQDNFYFADGGLRVDNEEGILQENVKPTLSGTPVGVIAWVGNPAAEDAQLQKYTLAGAQYVYGGGTFHGLAVAISEPSRSMWGIDYNNKGFTATGFPSLADTKKRQGWSNTALLRSLSNGFNSYWKCSGVALLDEYAEQHPVGKYGSYSRWMIGSYAEWKDLSPVTVVEKTLGNISIASPLYWRQSYGSSSVVTKYLWTSTGKEGDSKSVYEVKPSESGELTLAAESMTATYNSSDYYQYARHFRPFVQF